MNLVQKLSALICIFIASNTGNSKPNVMLIVCDDLNTHVSTSGYPHIKTPHLDQLAKAGVTFKRAYCQYPVCGPSRASFLSGLYPESTGVLDNKADIRDTRPGISSLPQFMKENGYWTGGVGKIFHTPRTCQRIQIEAAFFFENGKLALLILGYVVEYFRQYSIIGAIV